MERTVKFNGREIRLNSSLFTIISYRNVFGTELFDDVEKLENQLDKNKNDVGKVIDVLFRLIYILHKPFYNDSYDRFLQSFDFSVLTNVEELTLLANTIGELLGDIKKNSDGTDVGPKK